jgi:prephenate dehydrogenase
MSTKIAILGFGQIGASIGLALAPYKDKVSRVGHSADVKLMKKTSADGAFDHTEIKLPDAVRGADIVVLDFPTDLVKDALRLVAKEVKPETVVLCFSVVFKTIYEWANELLPAGQPFVILQPVINPERLADWNDALETAHADLFEKCDMIIAADHGTASRAMQTAADLATLLKAKPYFTEPEEADGIFAGVEQLPLLNAAALVNALTHSPGWGDARRITSRAFFRTASISMLFDEEEYFGITSLMNRENTARVLDELIAELQEMHRLISEDDEEGLRASLRDARRAYELWLDQRTSGEWDRQEKPEIPGSANILERLFGGRPRDLKDKR